MNQKSVSSWLQIALQREKIYHINAANYALQFNGYILTFTSMLNYTVTPFQVNEIRNIEISPLHISGSKYAAVYLSNKSYKYIESILTPVVQSVFYSTPVAKIKKLYSLVSMNEAINESINALLNGKNYNDTLSKKRFIYDNEYFYISVVYEVLYIYLVNDVSTDIILSLEYSDIKTSLVYDFKQNDEICIMFCDKFFNTLLSKSKTPPVSLE